MSSLVAGEVVLSVMLLAGAGLLVKSFITALRVETGLRVDHLLTFRLALPQAKYSSAPQAAMFYRNLVDRLNSSPGVEAAAGVSTLPMTGGMQGGAFEVQGRPKAADWVDTSVQYSRSTPGYFRTMGIPILRGRDFDERDTEASLPVGIVNDTLARQFFAGQDPIGQRYKDAYDGKWRTIVGVVGSVKSQQPMNPPVPGLFCPHAQSPSNWMWITLRARGDEAELTGMARAAVHGLDPDLPLLKIRTMREVVSDSLSGTRLLMQFLAGFALFALLLDAIGIYGIVDYSVRQRTHEMGIRVALGASYGSVLRLVLQKGTLPAAAGVLLGLPAALAASGLLRAMLYGIGPRDLTVFLGVPVVLLLVALGASILPARRAARVDPVIALRCE